MIMMKELPYDAYGSLNEIFGDEQIKLFREKFDNKCFEVADIIKGIMNQNGIIAEIRAKLENADMRQGSLYTKE